MAWDRRGGCRRRSRQNCWCSRGSCTSAWRTWGGSRRRTPTAATRGPWATRCVGPPPTRWRWPTPCSGGGAG
eukprot:9051256-Lingulodinium_polyedra.AAC.1